MTLLPQPKFIAPQVEKLVLSPHFDRHKVVFGDTQNTFAQQTTNNNPYVTNSSMKEYHRDPNSDLNSVFEKVDEKMKKLRKDPPKLHKVLLQPSFEVKNYDKSLLLNMEGGRHSVIQIKNFILP